MYLSPWNLEIILNSMISQKTWHKQWFQTFGRQLNVTDTSWSTKKTSNTIQTQVPGTLHRVHNPFRFIYRARSSILCLRGSCIEEIYTICTFQNKGVDAVKLMPFMVFAAKETISLVQHSYPQFKRFQVVQMAIQLNKNQLKLHQIAFYTLKYIFMHMLQYSCAFKINPSSFIPMPIDVANHFILNPFSYFLIYFYWSLENHHFFSPFFFQVFQKTQGERFHRRLIWEVGRPDLNPLVVQWHCDGVTHLATGKKLLPTGCDLRRPFVNDMVGWMDSRSYNIHMDTYA